LTEFRKTMRSLGGFSVAATPVLEDLGAAAPALTDATRTLTPFSEALTVSLKSLGKAGEGSGPLFAEADPVVRKAGTLAKSGVKPTRELAALFTSLEQTGGWDGLVELIYNGAATFNGFDQYGHFGRTLVLLSNCTDYSVRVAGTEGGGCSPRFHGPGASEAATTSAAALYRLLLEEQGGEIGGGKRAPAPEGLAEGRPTDRSQAAGTKGAEGEAGVAESSKTGGTEPLLDYLLGP
jgi:hypothetical protein